ncbi:FOG: TPR repeat [Moesziomyces antarcticus T-34]|uniref:FOG: TPR repeat n=1 Tax=Pseudozyma antarctica (strain T-34) TaxID=1151754 RepID=M9MGT8_PSEA3|nr:FOG: TPR repeat [Moesziomyces antarcticus T-34]
MDDLLDLTWQPSSASHSSTQPSQPSKSAYKPPNYHTPPLSSSPAAAPAIAPSKAAPAPAPAPVTANTDAFSSLFAPSSSSSTKQQANLSLAQRQQLAQQQARNKADDEKRRNDALWSGIDSSAWIQPAAASRPSSAANAAKPTTQPSDPWDFDSFTAPSSKPSAPALTTTQPTPTKSHSTTAPANNDPFDFDGCQSSHPAPTAAHVDQSDDILGALAMPVSELKPSRPHDRRVAALSSSASASSSADSSRVPSPASGRRPTPTARSRSPPPHVIGQIVEMGFSPQQARQALARTPSGLDVQAALELLVGADSNDQDEQLARQLQARERTSFRDSDDDDAAHAAAPRRRQPPQSGTQRDTDEATPDWQHQADQLYAQASEIGSSVLTKASAFWSSAKAQAQKALEEHNRAGAERSTTPSDAGSERHRARRWGNPTATAAKSKEWEGKPKWMVEAELAQSNDTAATASSDEPAQLGGGPAGASPQLPTRPAAAPKAAYASPHRRGPTRSSAASPAPPTALKRRAIPREASHTISSAARNKDEGNEHFRRGAYADAEASYTRGIAALESSSFDSVRLVPLLSNRANVRLKNGDTAGTIGDCDRLVGIVLAPFGGGERDASGRVAVYRPSQEADLPAELGEVKLRETFGKALVRRAQALEASERWKLARADWAVLLEYEQLEGSGVRTTTSHLTFARQGMERCSRMLNPTPRVAASQPKPKPAAPRRPPATASTGGVGGEASAAFAQQQQKAAVEESEKFALKDAVDAKIDAWKRGKETNLRALLSSLDTIVWPELGWKPIALHQVLDAAGLKKNYTRAIARLHPDKIQSSATTEHKMIAAAAFHALNEAWNASQS